jgi:3-oxoacyl-[acyl-carrier protein] reductase
VSLSSGPYAVEEVAVLHDTVALVTGGGCGIGAAIAGRPARDGADVPVTHRTATARAARVVVRITANGRWGPVPCAAEGKPGSVVAEADRALTALGRYDDPADIADAVAHVAGADGRDMTGATITVDGGAAA